MKRFIKIQSVIIVTVLLLQTILAIVPIIPVSYAVFIGDDDDDGEETKEWDISSDGSNKLKATYLKGELSIIGYGKMRDFSEHGAPWYGFNTLVKKITIANGPTNIGNYAFEGCDIAQISIPIKIKTVGKYAFSECSNLKTVSMANEVTTISNYAFYNCNSLENITLSSNLTTIGNHAFEGCRALKNITIPSNVTTIGESSFEKCTSLKNITIPNKVNTMGNYTFKYCSSLESASIPASVTSIGVHAFFGCTSLTSINVSQSNTNYSAVDGVLFNKNKTELLCYSAGKTDQDYMIPESVTSIFGSAFWNSRSLVSITVPEGVTNINNGAFKVGTGYDKKHVYYYPTCTAMTEYANNNPDEAIFSALCGWNIGATASDDVSALLINESTLIIGGSGNMKNYTSSDKAPWYSERSKIKKVVINNGVKNVGDIAFYNCTNISEVSFPDSLKIIGSSAFRGCTSIREITLPDGVKEIKQCAFFGCSGLRCITLSKYIESIGEQALYTGKDYNFENERTSIMYYSGTKQIVNRYKEQNPSADFWTNINEIGLDDKGKPEMFDTESSYLTNGVFVTNIIPNTDINSFRSNFSEGYEVNIDNTVVGTGSIVTITNENEDTTVELEIVVLGDLDGDGKVTMTDILKANRTRLENEILERVQEKAADMIEDGVINLVDLFEMNKLRFI